MPNLTISDVAPLVNEVPPAVSGVAPAISDVAPASRPAVVRASTPARMSHGLTTALTGLPPLRAFIRELKPWHFSGRDVGTTRGHARIQAKPALLCAGVLFFGLHAHAADLKLPSHVVAGNGAAISASGSGDATLYVAGPGTAIKRKVQLGQDITLSADELKNSGRYLVAIEGVGSGAFYVTAANVGSIAFLARPSRVPANTPDVISGTAFLFDPFQNLVIPPQPVKFDLSVNRQSLTRTATSKDGMAYVKLDSSKKEGPAQFVVSSGSASARRVVQQVASEPCNIRMTARPDKNGILVQTDPIRDCAGNPVPDGTIVTFTSTAPGGKSTVDARIKRGTAQALLPATNNATISVASGVVVGNEIHWGGGL